MRFRNVFALALAIAACGSTSPLATTAEAAPPPSPSTSGPHFTTTTQRATAQPALELLNSEPVVAPAANEKYANPGAMVFEDGTYHMLRNSFSEWPGESQTDLLISEDGLVWVSDSDRPIFTGDDVPFGENNAFPMSVVPDGGRWVAYFYTYDGQSAPAAIGRATAPELAGPWSVDPLPVLSPGPEGAWDSLQVREPSVVKVGDEWRMYYTGSDRTTAAIGLATSRDGVTWIKEDGPILEPGQPWWDSGSIGCPQVVRFGDEYVMTFDAAGRGAFGVGLATSPDGLSWTPWPANPMVTDSSAPGGQQIWQSELLAVGEELRWFLEVGPGASRTDVYAFAIAPQALDNPPDPEMSAEAVVTGQSVIVRVATIGLGIGFESGSTEPRLVHPHIYLDRPPPVDGDIVPLDDPSIAHSPSGTIVLRDLAPGEHTLWLVGADGTDRAVVPPEPFRIDITIEP